MPPARSTRPVLCFLATAAACAGAPPALGQQFPDRPLRLIVGFAPGGVADIMARGLARHVTDGLGQHVIVDNRAGAGGTIAMQLAARSSPDGYTLLMGSSTQFSINPALRRNLPYDPVADYTPITRLALTPVLLTVQPAMPAKTVTELIALARSGKRGIRTFASTGYGGATHIAGELFKRVAKLDVTHVPYKGGSASVAALVAGDVDMSFGAVSTALPHLRAGRLRALAVTSADRLEAIRDVPTFIEAGLRDFEVVQWFGVFAPAGVPGAITKRLNAALVAAVDAPELRKHYAAQGVEFVSSSPEALGAYVKTQLARWTSVVRDLGISPP